MSRCRPDHSRPGHARDHKDGEGNIVVTVRVTSAEGHPGYYGVARGYVKGGFFGGSYLNSASAAGESIAKAIATGVVQ